MSYINNKQTNQTQNQTMIKTLLTSAAIAVVGLTAVEAGIAAPRAGLRAAQYELCDAGRYYRQDVANGYMSRKQTIQEAAMYAVDLQNKNGWGPETNTALAQASEHGYLGGNCNIYR